MVSKLRSDGRQDSDRPHYYSQYWIDVAMGKTSPSLPEAAPSHGQDDALDDIEADILAMAPKPEPKPAKPAKAAEKKPETHAPMTSFADLANIDALMKSSAAMDDDEAPDISNGLNATGPDITLDVLSGASPEASDDSFEGFSEGEDEEDEGDWGGGRRKPKQGKTKRHERHDY